MKQRQPIPRTKRLVNVTPAMTEYAVSILRDHAFGDGAQDAPREIDGVRIVARVEWHPPEPAIDHWHRGVTLYELDGEPLAEGVDVSKYQPDVDWERVAATGKTFAYVKATEGLATVNMLAVGQHGAALAAGLLTGFYHFFRPSINAGAQAKHFIDYLGSSLSDAALPPALDVETLDHGTAPSLALRRTSEWIDAVSSTTGSKVMVYCSPSFWERLGGSVSESSIWIAHYDVSAPRVPIGSQWTEPRFWQYASDVLTPGIQGKADANRFMGTCEELRCFARDAHTSGNVAP